MSIVFNFIKESVFFSLLIYVAYISCYIILTADTSNLNGSDIVMIEVVKELLNGIY